MEKGNKKTIRAWAFYDWANSSYNLVITATIFPIYYESITKTENSDIVSFLGLQFKNTALYTYALAFAYLVIASIAPLLSGVADYNGTKKRFMQFFCYMGAISCSMMYFFEANNLWLGILLVILACIGWSGSVVFYNSYLPEIAEPQDQDRVSAKGFALGFVGSSLLLIFNLTLILFPEWYFDVDKKLAAIMTEFPGLEKGAALKQAKDSFAGIASRIGFLTVGIWWFSFAQYTFYVLPSSQKKDTGKNILYKGYNELRNVWHQLKSNPKLTRFLTAFFIYSMGVQTVMLVATLFGKKELGLKADQLIVTILIIQFVAAIGAFLFSFSSRKLGNIKTLQIATLIWIGVCISAYSFIRTAEQFYVLAFIVGLVMGGIQALSRSTYSKMLPEATDHVSYFSFYDVCEKLSIVLGMALFGIIEELTDNMRNPVLSLLTFFIIGFILLFRVKENKTN